MSSYSEFVNNFSTCFQKELEAKVNKKVVTKRTFDIICSLAFLFFAVPFLIAIAIAVRVDSPGTAFFKQKRLGLHGAPFMIWKFRTMVDGTGTPLDVVKVNDARVTRLGRFLRSTHLDELPQLINVLLGEMSMVGPRPLEATLAEHLAQTVAGYERCFEMKPGLTGPSQILGRKKVHKWGWRCEVWLNSLYERQQCFWYDLQLLVCTLPHVLKRDGV